MTLPGFLFYAQIHGLLSTREELILKCEGDLENGAIRQHVSSARFSWRGYRS